MRDLKLKESKPVVSEALSETKKQIRELEKRVSDITDARNRAKSVIKEIRYYTVPTDIVANVKKIGAQVGLEEYKFIDQSDQIRNITNSLEAEIYRLDEVFKEELREIHNQLEQLHDTDLRESVHENCGTPQCCGKCDK